MTPEVPPQQSGLAIPPEVALGLGRDAEAEEHRRWDTFDASMAYLESMGLHAPQQPEYHIPRVTSEELLTENRTQFTVLYAKVLNWHGYVATMQAEITGMLLGVTNELALLSARLRRKFFIDNRARTKDKKWVAAEIDDAVTTYPRVQELMLEAQSLKQRKFVLDARLDSLDKTLRVVSRQVEIARQEREGAAGESGVARRAHDSPQRGMRGPSPGFPER